MGLEGQGSPLVPKRWKPTKEKRVSKRFAQENEVGEENFGDICGMKENKSPISIKTKKRKVLYENGSWITLFFEKLEIEEGVWKCKFPQHSHKKFEIVRSKNSSHLIEHFETHHSGEMGNIKELAESGNDIAINAKNILLRSQQRTKKSQTNLLSFLNQAKKSNSKLERDLNWCLVLIKENLSFNSAGSDTMRNFVRNYLGQIFPDRKLLSGALLEGLYEITLKCAKDALKDCMSISLTADGWYAPRMESFIAITAHFIDEKWNSRRITLGVIEIFGSHTAKKMKNIILQVVETFTSNSCLISGFVVDNAADINKAGTLILGTNEDVFNCFGHTVQLAVNDVLSRGYSEEINNVREIVKIIRKSRIVSNELKQLKGSKHCELSLDVVTRWNSTYHMLRNFLKNEYEIAQIMNKEPYNSNFAFVSLPERETIESLEKVSFLLIFFCA